MPLEGDTEEEEDYTSLADLKTNGTDRRPVRNLDSTSEKSTHACLLPTKGRERRLKLPRTLAGFPQPPKSML